jgi:putative hemolysin
MRLLGLDAINAIYAGVENESGCTFAAKYFENEDVRYIVDNEQLRNIPAKGAAIVVANHPTGLLDGLIMLDILLKTRPDVKLLGNPLLKRLVPVQSYFIELDPFDKDRSKNISGIKTALEHLQNGGLLMLCPAGEVSTWHKGFRVEDKKWSAGIVKIIRSAKTPIIPVYLGGKNSFAFHFLGKIHPLLRTAQLPRELVNKKHKIIPLAIGSPLVPARAKTLKTNSEYADFLRNNIYLLKKTIAPPQKKKVQPIEKVIQKEIVIPQNSESILLEIKQLRQPHLLFEQGSMSVFFAPPDKMLHIIQEIGRLREITFREVGEGTNLEIDLDKYDGYYWQLFIWDNANNQIVGGYRLGMGADIAVQSGREGFYTHSLFRLSKKMESVLKETIELGRSFIVKEYQRNPLSLLLLWRGILTILLSHKQYHYLMGPASISNEYKDVSKSLIMDYIKKEHFEKELSSWVKARNKPCLRKNKLVQKQIKSINHIDLLDKLVLDMENNRRGVPILIKKYLQINGKVLSFNIDKDFNDVLDALMLLDISKVPASTLAMLTKENSEN